MADLVDALKNENDRKALGECQEERAAELLRAAEQSDPGSDGAIEYELLATLWAIAGALNLQGKK